MKVTFRLRFCTQPGQSLWLSSKHPLPSDPVPLQYMDADHWQATVTLPEQIADTELNYSYILRQPDRSQLADWGPERKFIPAVFGKTGLLVLDSWNHPGFYSNAFYTAPFKKALLAENITPLPIKSVPNVTHTFRVKSPLLSRGQTICLLGESSTLGNWNTSAPVLLNRQPDDDYFSASLDLTNERFPFAYKYGVFDVAENRFVRYEGGANRNMSATPTPNQHTLINDGFTVLPDDTWRGTGVAVPVFSLRSEKSFGVGEFADLKRLADWGQSIGLKLIQLLPINDTSATGTWKDSYPYAAISAFALHPLYLNLNAVVSTKNKPLLKALESERHRLNALDAVDYEAVMQAKIGFLKKIFPSQQAATFRAKEYKSFFAENQHWLVPYAAFCFLRDKFGTVDYNQWPEHQQFDFEKINDLAKNNDDIAFHFFVQYHLHRQLKDATAYAHNAGLIVKGDIAIGVYRHGADVWQEPELFHMDVQAGAPPDPFSDKGQNWGFPTYNWPRMAADGFAWWSRRFSQMGNYFDAFRIDHILGFFRIWSSPASAVEGILGHFVPAIPLDPAEFPARGIPFDHERFTRPFINDAVLSEFFGEDANFVRRQFLISTGHDQYALKPEFATQRQVENYFAKLQTTKPKSAKPRRKKNSQQTSSEQSIDSFTVERIAKFKTGLFDLISNVILLEAEGKLHFRFAIEKTQSFKHLPPDIQPKLHALYVDYFFRRQDDFWMDEALKKLPALKRVTNMLICGEDLGLVPACVPKVMQSLGFLSLEIQRMPKALGAQFSRPAEAPYLSVVTPSTHDMSTIRGWWEEDVELTQKFYNHELGMHGEAPRSASPELVEAIIRQHLASSAMWSVFQLQDLLGTSGTLRRANIEEERINVPAIPNYYWRYRMHLSLENLQRSEEFNSHLKHLIAAAGR